MKFNWKNLITLLLLSTIAAGCNPFVSTRPAGLVRTSNGGADWVMANVISGNQKASLADYSFSVLTFANNKREVIYAGSYTGGLYKSEDSAGSWKQVLSRISVYDVVVSPTDEQVIYAAGFGVDHGKLLRSLDSGKTWEEMYSEEATNNAVRAVAINPANVSEVTIGLSSGNLVKSFDGGRNWVLVRNFEDRINRINWSNGAMFVVLRTKGVFVSTDGGVNFTELTAPILHKSGDASGLYLNSTDGASVFSQFAVNDSDPSEMYVTTDKGVFKTITGGKTWVKLNVPIQRGDIQFRAVAFAHSNPKIVYLSAGSTVYKTLDGGVSFQTQGIVTSGFINYILVDRELPQIVYAGVFTE